MTSSPETIQRRYLRRSLFHVASMQATVVATSPA